jgi:hypothetical protein
MADRDTDTPLDPLGEIAELERQLRELDEEERGLLQRLAETKRAVAVQRAASRPPPERAGAWRWAGLMYFVGLVASFLLLAAR